MYYNRNSQVFYDGDFISVIDAVCSSYSQTLHYGNGVFEGIRSYATARGPKIFKAKEHFERLKYSAGVMGLELNYTVDELMDIALKLLRLNDLSDAYIRPIVMAHDNMTLTANPGSHLLIQCWNWGKYMGDKAVRVMASTYQRPNPRSCVIDAKVCGYYVNSILSTKEAKENGYDEALLTDINGHIAECSAANFFMERAGKLFTPPVGHILPGITRATIIDICKREQIEVEETYFTLEDVKKADSAFFTGTAAEVAPISSVDDHQFPLEWKDSLGAKLHQLYHNEVHADPVTI